MDHHMLYSWEISFNPIMNILCYRMCLFERKGFCTTYFHFNEESRTCTPSSQNINFLHLRIHEN